MIDREIMHKLLDVILDTGNMSAIYTEFFPGIPGKIPGKQETGGLSKDRLYQFQ